MESVKKIKIFKYELPLSKAIIIKNNKINYRRGLILNIQTSSGLSTFGEISPLPNYSYESLQDVIKQVKDIKSFILNSKIKELEFNSSQNDNNQENIIKSFNLYLNKYFNYNNFNIDLYPSIKFGVEMALLNLLFLKNNDLANDLVNKIKGKTNNIYLPICKLFTDIKNNINIESDVLEVINEGYNTIKIKVGRNAFNDEINYLKKIFTFVKENNLKIKIRLDANKLWKFEEALDFSNKIGIDNINEFVEFIEDPFDDLKLYEKFYNLTKIPIALDENLVKFINLYENENHKNKEIKTNNLNYLKAFILKPSVIGGFSKCCEIIKIANENGLKVVLSSSFESSLAIRSIILFSFLMKLNKTSAGLDTLKFFKEDLLINKIKINNGKITLEDILKDVYDENIYDENINYNLLKVLEI